MSHLNDRPFSRIGREATVTENVLKLFLNPEIPGQNFKFANFKKSTTKIAINLYFQQVNNFTL